MKFLFWNTHNNKAINPILRELVVENKVDIIILAEYDADESELLKLCEDENIILMNKRPGVLVHEDDEGRDNTLLMHLQSRLMPPLHYLAIRVLYVMLNLAHSQSIILFRF